MISGSSANMLRNQYSSVSPEVQYLAKGGLFVDNDNGDSEKSGMDEPAGMATEDDDSDNVDVPACHPDLTMACCYKTCMSTVQEKKTRHMV